MDLGSAKRRVAVIGAGMTLFRRRLRETGRELAFYATKMALEQAGITLRDVDAVVLGSAPDAFDGVHRKGEYLLDGAGGHRRPYMRVFVGGGTGVFTPIAAWWHVASGHFDVVLAVCEEKMSSVRPHSQKAFTTIFDPIDTRPLGPNLIWIFALEMMRYMHVHGVTKEQIALITVKNKRNALDHPCAQLPGKITVEDVLKSEVIVWPVQLLDVSPPSDGAAALVLAAEHAAKHLTDEPVWLDGVGWCIDSTYWTNRDLYYPRYVEYSARMAYRMAGIKNPPKEIDVAEPYDPFNYKEAHHAEGLLLARKGEYLKGVKDEGDIFARYGRDGELPVCPSGGLLGVGNPISAAGLMKVCEVFWQLRGEAGKRQVKGDPVTGVAQAWGDLMQVSTVVVLRR